MKKILILAAIFCLCFQTISVLAATPDFSGVWELDVSKSTFPDTMPVESITLKVSQTEKELKIESTIKTNQSPMQDEILPGGGGTQTAIYSLEGKETTAQAGSGITARKEIRKAAMTANGKLNLTVTRIFNGEKGNAAVKINEIWELLDDGKTLKATRYVETPDGAMNAEMYFTKKSSGALTVKGAYDVPGNKAEGNTGKIPNSISGGVLNGKALKLEKPAYPAAARAVKAGGAVNVQVTIDEQGDIISANAVSGHPLLRSAAEEAARNSKFSPTLLEGVPVKVTGVLIYNFAP